MEKTVAQGKRKRSNLRIMVQFMIPMIMAFLIQGCDSGSSSSQTKLELDFNSVTWMTDQIDKIGHRTLREISIPGSHDAGMNKLSNTFLGSSCNTITQKKSIYDQLQAGARYFDIRPTRWKIGGEWYAGHFQDLDYSIDTLFFTVPIKGYVGGTGQSLESILEDVAKFCGEMVPDSKELIILNFSHFYVVGEGTLHKEGRPCTHDEINDALSIIKSKLANYSVDWQKYRNPVEATFKDRKENEYVLLRFETDSVATDREQGIYNESDFPIYNSYSNSNVLTKMHQDQEKKLVDESYGTNRMFLLSHTLTLSTGEIVNCALVDLCKDPEALAILLELGIGLIDAACLAVDEFDSPTSIMHLAVNAKKWLGKYIEDLIEHEDITQGNVPNIIYSDLFDETVTAQSVKVNEEYDHLPPWWELYHQTLGAPGVHSSSNSLDSTVLELKSNYTVYTTTQHGDLLAFDELGNEIFKKTIDGWRQDRVHITDLYPPIPYRRDIYINARWPCFYQVSEYDTEQICPDLPAHKADYWANNLGEIVLTPDGRIFFSAWMHWTDNACDEKGSFDPPAHLFNYSAYPLRPNWTEALVIDHCVMLTPPLVDISEGYVYVATMPVEQQSGASSHKKCCKNPPTEYKIVGYFTDDGTKKWSVNLGDKVPVNAPMAIGRGPYQNEPVIFFTAKEFGAGAEAVFLMAINADTGAEHFEPIELEMVGNSTYYAYVTGAVYSPIDNRVYVGYGRSNHDNTDDEFNLVGYEFTGGESPVFKIDAGHTMSTPVLAQWDTTPPAYCICVSTAGNRTFCYSSDGLKVYDQPIVDGYDKDTMFPPAIPHGGFDYTATKVYVANKGHILARQGTLHHPGLVE